MRLSQRLALGYIRAKFKLLSTISKKKAAASAFSLFCTPQRRHKKQLPKIFGQASPLQIQLEGITLRGWRWNHPGSRKVLLLHGFESSITNFDRYVSPLVRKGYEVLAFDAPAHGRSGGTRITAPLYKQMIVEICRQFGPVHSFMAHSFGGLALSLAVEEMDHDCNTRMVLIAPATETVTAIDSFFRFLELDPALRKEFDHLILQKGGVPPAWYSISRAMKKIRARVLWIHDTDDDTTPIRDVMSVKSENHEHVGFVFTSGLGHRRIYRDNKVTRQVIDFL
jgi:pimeloyl-ACP methyl ester carboxylesterase